MPERSNRTGGRDTYLPEQSNRKGGRDTWQSWIERGIGMTCQTVRDKKWREVGILLGQARHGCVRVCVCVGGGWGGGGNKVERGRDSGER